jgi:hypothetical protein
MAHARVELALKVDSSSPNHCHLSATPSFEFETARDCLPLQHYMIALWRILTGDNEITRCQELAGNRLQPGKESMSTCQLRWIIGLCQKQRVRWIPIWICKVRRISTFYVGNVRWIAVVIIGCTGVI